jgi:hypothetical protein
MQAISNYNLWTLIALYVAFTFFVSTTASFHLVSKNVLETELGEALNDKLYLKSDPRYKTKRLSAMATRRLGFVERVGME